MKKTCLALIFLALTGCGDMMEGGDGFGYAPMMGSPMFGAGFGAPEMGMEGFGGFGGGFGEGFGGFGDDD